MSLPGPVMLKLAVSSGSAPWVRRISPVRPVAKSISAGSWNGSSGLVSPALALMTAWRMVPSPPFGEVLGSKSSRLVTSKSFCVIARVMAALVVLKDGLGRMEKLMVSAASAASSSRTSMRKSSSVSPSGMVTVAVRGSPEKVTG